MTISKDYLRAVLTNIDNENEKYVFTLNHDKHLSRIDDVLKFSYVKALVNILALSPMPFKMVRETDDSIIIAARCKTDEYNEFKGMLEGINETLIENPISMELLDGKTYDSEVLGLTTPEYESASLVSGTDYRVLYYGNITKKVYVRSTITIPSNKVYCNDDESSREVYRNFGIITNTIYKDQNGNITNKLVSHSFKYSDFMEYAMYVTWVAGDVKYKDEEDAQQIK